MEDEAAAETSRREQETWDAADKSGSEGGYRGYIKDWPAGRYTSLAQVRLRKLQTDLAARQEADRQRQQAEAAKTKQKQEAERPLQQAAQTGGSGPAMVRIPGKNYDMGKFEVTQGEWKAVMGNNPSHFSNCGDTCPVDNVSWNDAQEFIQKLNAKTGKQYRLPTEAEWEYACYGGSKTEYCGGDDLDAVAWYDKNSGNTTHPVGQKQSNGYGLYDMSGNVWEWMQDELTHL